MCCCCEFIWNEVFYSISVLTPISVTVCAFYLHCVCISCIFQHCEHHLWRLWLRFQQVLWAKQRILKCWRVYLSSIFDGFGFHRRSFDYGFTIAFFEVRKVQCGASSPGEAPRVFKIVVYWIQRRSASNSSSLDRDLWRILRILQTMYHFQSPDLLRWTASHVSWMQGNYKRASNNEVREQWYCTGKLRKMDFISSKYALVLHFKQYSARVLRNCDWYSTVQIYFILYCKIWSSRTVGLDANSHHMKCRAQLRKHWRTVTFSNGH